MIATYPTNLPSRSPNFCIWDPVASRTYLAKAIELDTDAPKQMKNPEKSIVANSSGLQYISSSYGRINFSSRSLNRGIV